MSDRLRDLAKVRDPLPLGGPEKLRTCDNSSHAAITLIYNMGAFLGFPAQVTVRFRPPLGASGTVRAVRFATGPPGADPENYELLPYVLVMSLGTYAVFGFFEQVHGIDKSALTGASPTRRNIFRKCFG